MANAAFNLSAVRKDRDSSGRVVTYACDYLTSASALRYNTYASIAIPSYFDLAYPCSKSLTNIIEPMISLLLEKTAVRWEILPDGATCKVPVTVDNSRIVLATSEPGAAVVKGLACSKLRASNSSSECCNVVQLNMTVWALPGYNEQDFRKFHAAEIDSGHLTANTSSRIAFIGSEITLAPADGANFFPQNYGQGTGQAQGQEQQGKSQGQGQIAGITQGQTNSTQERGSLTVIGGFVVAGLVAAFLGVILVVVRRRRRYQKEMEIDRVISNARAGNPFSDDQSTVYAVDVLNDLHTQEGMLEKEYHSKNNIIEESFEMMPNNSFEDQYSSSTQRAITSNNYDLGETFKNNIMSTYGDRPSSSPRKMHYGGPSTIDVVPPYPMEETSDSEVDSWAQTDGTVGSLEENLAQMEGEI